MNADADAEAAVRALLKEFADAYARRDLNGLLATFTPDAVLIGTGADETRRGIAEIRAQTERDWSQSDAASMRVDVHQVRVAGPIAWATADVSIQAIVGGQAASVEARLSVVATRRNERWQVVQCHLSLPAVQQAEGASWPTSLDELVASVLAERPDLAARAAPDGTVTIMFTDIEGSTELTVRLGDLRWLDLLRTHNALVRREVQTHGGFEVKSQGDGFMLAFQSTRRALHCAVAIQRAFAAYNSDAEDHIVVRAGVHTGEVLKEAEDFFGKHVILASRIADQATGGQVLVSSLVRDLTESMGDIAFAAAGKATLKGFDQPVRLFEVRWDANASPAESGAP